MHGFIAQYGLIAVYLGAALEGDASVMAAGALSHQGLFPVAGAILAAALGAWSSDVLIFSLARRHADRPWVRRATEALGRSALLSRFLARPTLLVMVFRFLPGARTIGPAALATVAPVRPPVYVAITAMAAVTWASILVIFGHSIARLLETLLGQLRLHTHLAIWVAVIAASLATAWYLRHRWLAAK